MVTNKAVQDAIAQVHLFHVPGTGTVLCALLLTNGHVLTGEAHCAPGTQFDSALGVMYARQDAESKIEALLAFTARGPLNPTPAS